MENCSNCNEVIAGNFCINCGQKKYKRIDRKYIVDEVQYTFLHANKGLLYSVKNILKNPGRTAREFIDGNRVNHYKPILLTFLLSGISAFLSYKVLGFMEMINSLNSNKNVNSKMMGDTMSLLSNYSSIFMILLIPLFAITTKIAFKKWGHNYYEHIVINSYILSTYTLISIIFIYPIMFLLKHKSPSEFYNLILLSYLLVPILLVWFFKGFYADRPLKKIAIKVGGVIGLAISGYLLLIIVVVIGIGIYAAVNGPEALKYIKPK